MSLVRLTGINVERFELVANPSRTFQSSSVSGPTGSVKLFVDNSTTVRDVLTTNSTAGFFSDTSIESARAGAVLQMSSGSAESALKQYLSIVNNTTQSVRANKHQEIIRTHPGSKLNKNFMKKRVIQNSLFPYYKNIYPTCDWGFTNYNSINFVTGSDLPDDSVMIYPAGTGTFADEDQNLFAPATGFTFDFYINPRYGVISEGADIKAGTILHMSSCYAISLISGSSVGYNGLPDAFRLLFQLSQSAEIPPSNFLVDGNTITTPSTINSGFVYASSDNSLKLNSWHHVAFRWGGIAFQGGTGSIVIDGGEDTKFEIPSASVMQASMPVGSSGDPDAMFLGNFYEGSNTGINQIGKFFNTNAAANEGVLDFGSLPLIRKNTILNTL